jgi:CDP-2,3-bis-(O-geranylgeranyl)-sn-glycerol synthase
MQALRVLALLGIANLAPILATRLCRARWAMPLDRGRLLRDGRPLFGEGKTLRGLAASLLCTAAAAPLLGLGVPLGAAIAAAAMAGDLLASFAKRRLGLAPHARSFGLDQLPEVLLPILVLHPWLGLDWPASCAVVVAFVMLDIVGSLVLFRLRIRQKPY